MYYIYILQSSKDREFYTGMTNNVVRRVHEHNAGHVKPTKARVPFMVVHIEAFISRKEARAREKYFKSGVGREERKRIVNKKIPR